MSKLCHVYFLSPIKLNTGIWILDYFAGFTIFKEIIAIRCLGVSALLFSGHGLYLTTLWIAALIEKLTVTASQEISFTLEIMLTKSLACPSVLRKINLPHTLSPYPLRFISIFSHARHVFQVGSPQVCGVPFTTLHTCYMSRLSHSSRYDNHSDARRTVQILKPLALCVHHPFTSSVLGSNVLLCILFSNV